MEIKHAAIDWGRVREDILKKDRIPSSGALPLAVEKYLKKAGRLAKPKAISVKKNRVSFPGKRLSSYIKGACHVHIFLVTVGGAIEKEASRLMEQGDALGGYLLDRIGSFAVESLAENLEEKMRDFYTAGGLSVSARLSPGYCDWPIEEQLKLAKMLKFSRAGVRLTESCMMVPKKSISGLIAVGPKGLFPSKKRSQCNTCTMTECDYRRTI